jgi:ATP-dependent exoDNAse (exonuclease V) beta subunit
LAKTATGRLDGPLPEAFTTQTETLKRMPLLELTEKLYAIFIEGTAVTTPLTSQSAYLCAFFDQVTAFTTENAGDAIAFLREWDECLCAKTIQSPELDGLRIISIHKSKGLEFPHVIIPFCDWRLEHSDILWCRPLEAPFDALPLAPIDYSQKGMKGTIYEKDYEEEHQQNTVDNLNLLYVAFTRASQSLFVIGKRGSKTSRSALIEQVLSNLTLQGATLSGEEDADAPLCFDFGCLPASHLSPLTSHPSTPTNPFLQTSTPIAVDIEVFDRLCEFKQSTKSMAFAQTEDDGEQRQNYIQLGNVLHNIFSSIRTTADTDTALKQLEQEGIIYSEDLSREKLGAMIRKRLADSRVAYWFSSRWQLYNECTILLPNGETRRPDRVMTDGRQTIVVDFKFGQERDEYHHQVREYISLLQQMGLPNVSGYLWFVYANRIVEVTPEII